MRYSRDCIHVKNKKEYAVVRYLRSVIKEPFIYDSSDTLQGCFRKRPDIFFDLLKHCVIVEVDENQHKRYDDSCECARINEIVNGIGERPLIIIRYNPDAVKSNGNIIKVTMLERAIFLRRIVEEEIYKSYDKFLVKIVQLFYDDSYDVYSPCKEEIITDLVCI